MTPAALLGTLISQLLLSLAPSTQPDGGFFIPATALTGRLDKIAPAVADMTILVGTASWADKSLAGSGKFSSGRFNTVHEADVSKAAMHRAHQLGAFRGP